MIRFWFADTFESPGGLQYDVKGRPFKESFGIAPKRAVQQRAEDDDAFDQANKEFFEEGISRAKMMINEPYNQFFQFRKNETVKSIEVLLRRSCYKGA